MERFPLKNYLPTTKGAAALGTHIAMTQREL